MSTKTIAGVLKGKVAVQALDQSTGLPVGKLAWLGDCSKASLTATANVIELKDSYSGKNQTIDRRETGNTVEMSVECTNATIANWAKFLRSSLGSVAAGTKTSVDMGTLEADAMFDLEVLNISTASFTVDGGAAVANTDYILDKKTGIITILTAGAWVATSVAYTGYSSAGILPNAPSYFKVVFAGFNTVTGLPIKVVCYKVHFEPLSEIQLVSDQYHSYNLKGMLLIDSNKAEDSDLGQLGAIFGG